MAYNYSAIKINGFTPPTVPEGGYSVTPNRIWSSNTGRSATGKMLGDVVATKYTVTMQWNSMSESNVKNLSKAVRSKPFFHVTFIDERGSVKTENFYSADLTYTLKRVENGKAIYNSVSVELIQQ